jgi:DNA polymerase elongation subunit (family B)
MRLFVNVPVLIEPSYRGFYVVNAGGVIDYYEYGTLINGIEIAPYVWKPSSRGKTYIETGTNQKITMKRQYFYDLTKVDQNVANRLRNSFVHNLVLYDPEVITALAKPGELRILNFDFEMGTVGKSFPKPDKDPIISYGYDYITDEYIDPHNNDIKVYIDKKNEKRLLKKFIETIVDYDPDIIAGYFSDDFDIPYFIHRCNYHGIDLSCLHRIPVHKNDLRSSYFYRDKDGKEFVSRYMQALGYGRVNDDIYSNSIKKDTYLPQLNVKDRKMKTVAAAYGLSGITDLEDNEKGNMFNVDNEKLRNYQISDIRCTHFLEEKSIMLSTELAEFLQWPLDLSIKRTTGRLADIYCGKNGFSKGYLCVRKNRARFPELYKYIDKGVKGKVEGAFTWSAKPSIYKAIQKLDFKSLYPSIILQFNISPETISLVEILDINNTKGVNNIHGININNVIGYWSDDTFDYYSIPDNNIGKRIVVSISKNEGYVVTFIKSLMKRRSEVKKQIEKIENEKSIEYLKGDALQLAIKIILNSLFGAYLNQHFCNTSILGGIMITAVGRELAHTIHKKYRDEIIEVDTDGFIFSNPAISQKEANEFVHDYIRKKYKKKEMFLFLEQEYGLNGKDLPSMFLLSRKNYILKSRNKIKMTGSTIKSSRFPKFMEKIIEDLFISIFEAYEKGEFNEEFLNEAERNILMSLHELPLKSFIVSAAIKQSIYEYKTIGKPSVRITKIIESGKSEEEIRREAEEYIRSRIPVWTSDEEEQEELSYKLNKIMKHSDWKGRLYQFALKKLDKQDTKGLSQMIKLIDMYREKYDVDPMIGDSIEYFYSNHTGTVDLADNLTDISQVNMDFYYKLIKTTMLKIARAIESEKDATEDISAMFGD